MIQQMLLADLPVALQLTQEALAKRLRVRQAAIFKIERRTDMCVSTLQHMVQAMGGGLEIRARFPEGDVRIPGCSPLRRAKVGGLAD